MPERTRAKTSAPPNKESRSRPAIRFYGLVMVGLMVACLVGGWWYVRYRDIEFARRATGLSLSDYDSLRICGDSDISIRYHMHARPELVREVTARRTVVEWPSYEPTFSDFGTRGCLPEVSNGSTTIYAAGCSDDQAWMAVLDPDTGDLWLEVSFPDNAGDIPGCPPGTGR